MKNGCRIGWVVLLSMFVCCFANAQTDEGFDVVFGQMAGDGDNPPLEGWAGARNSSDFGPTGIFPGIDSACGFFDAQAGAPGSYVAMNFNNARLNAEDTTSTWLLTPEISLADRTMISFCTRTVTASPFPDRLVVRISTNGDSVNVGEGPLEVGDFQTVLFDINPSHIVGGYPEDWELFETELKGFGDATGRIAFHYLNEFMNVNGNYIGIDSFRAIPFLLGDVNCDGFVNILDIQPFVDLLVGDEFNEKADLNGDGAVDLLDVEPFVEAIVSG